MRSQVADGASAIGINIDGAPLSSEAEMDENPHTHTLPPEPDLTKLPISDGFAEL